MISDVLCSLMKNYTEQVVKWQVTLCDPIWHVRSRSTEASCELVYSVCLTLPLPSPAAPRDNNCPSAQLSYATGKDLRTASR